MPLQRKYNDNNLAVAYYRYSSLAQSDASIEQQREAAQKYADVHGLRIIREYKDEHMTGTTDARPDYQRMLSEIEVLRPGSLILWKSDRLGRGRSFVPAAKERIRSAGCRICYVSGDIPDTPSGFLQESFEEVIDAYYSMELAVKIQRGMQYNAERCLYNGHQILGYTAVPAPEFGRGRKKYAVDDRGASIVRKIFSDYAAGKPMTAIAKELNQMGLRTVRGNVFTVNSLAHTLKQRAYIGEYRSGDFIKADGMPALISKELFEEAQKRLILNKRKGGQIANGLTEENAPRFWLTGRLYCGKCGTPMQGCSGTSKTGVKHYYYACGAYRKHKCGLRPVRKDAIEDYVCMMLGNYLCDTENLASLAVDVAAYHAERCNDDAVLRALKSEQKTVQKALDNLIRALEQGIFSESTQARLTELEQRKKDIASEIEVEEAKQQLQMGELSVRHFFEYYQNCDFKDPEVRDFLLEYFVDKVYVYDDDIVITGFFSENHIDIPWSDFDAELKKERSKKSSTACGSSPQRADDNAMSMLTAKLLDQQEFCCFYKEFL